jgi:hypothetical protein
VGQERAVAVSFEIDQWFVAVQAKLWTGSRLKKSHNYLGLYVDKPHGGSSSFYQDGTPR